MFWSDVIGSAIAIAIIIAVFALSVDWDRNKLYTEYQLVVTGTQDGCPCSWEVWKTKVRAKDLIETGPEEYIIPVDAVWDTVLVQNNCDEED